MTNARVDDLEKRLTSLEKELRGGLEDLNSRMLSRFTDVDRKVEVVLHRLEGLTGGNRGIVPRSGDPLLKRIRDVLWSYFFSSTLTITATVKTEDAQQGQPPLRLLDGCTDNQMNVQSSVQPPKNLPCLAACKKATPDNEHEKRMRSYILPPKEIRVTFEDIGALDETKKLLHELVILPLQRPELFKGLLEPSRGILLFGPPGTGKTMLAKALAHEAGATFINVSVSVIASKWFGDHESNTRALFTLAAKMAPTIIFIDEVDCMLGQKTGERDTIASVKNEFMIHWDGLLMKSEDRILVLAATNRPFNLDEAIIRRFEQRIMVGLPSQKSRESILRTLLSKEKTEQLDFKELATMTLGYSGSDLKNLCVAAAYHPLRELIQREESMRLKKQSNNQGSVEPATACRSINMEDLRKAINQVAKSCATESSLVARLEKWNKSFGDGGSRKKQQLSYFI